MPSRRSQSSTRSSATVCVKRPGAKQMVPDADLHADVGHQAEDRHVLVEDRLQRHGLHARGHRREAPCRGPMRPASSRITRSTSIGFTHSSTTSARSTSSALLAACDDAALGRQARRAAGAAVGDEDARGPLGLGAQPALDHGGRHVAGADEADRRGRVAHRAGFYGGGHTRADGPRGCPRPRGAQSRWPSTAPWRPRRRPCAIAERSRASRRWCRPAAPERSVVNARDR